eukprot:symbB.v1.2.025865.t1/scaffold2541.1/size78117/4
MTAVLNGWWHRVFGLSPYSVLEDSEVLEDVILDGQVFLLTVNGCPSCKGPKGCRCQMCGHERPGLVDYYGICQDTRTGW